MTDLVKSQPGALALPGDVPWADQWERDEDDRGTLPDLEEGYQFTVVQVRGVAEEDFREGGAVRQERDHDDEGGKDQ